MKNLFCFLVFIIFFISKGQAKKDIFLIPYLVGNKWGLADTLGKIKVQPQYDEVIDFKIEPRKQGDTYPHSFYYVRKNNEIHFIDAANIRYFKDFELVKSKNKDRVLFKKNGKLGFQVPFFDNGKWKMIGNPDSYKYDDFYNYPDSGSPFIIFVINHKKGLMFYDNEIIIPAEYDSISHSKTDNTWEFTAYKSDNNINKKYTKTINLPPPPAILNKNSNYKAFEKKEMDKLYKESYNLSEYEHVYYYRDYTPQIVKDNHGDKLGIASSLKRGKIDFIYDDIFPVEYFSSGDRVRYKEYA